jgi:hypothetical protein
MIVGAMGAVFAADPILSASPLACCQRAGISIRARQARLLISLVSVSDSLRFVTFDVGTGPAKRAGERQKGLQT